MKTGVERFLESLLFRGFFFLFPLFFPPPQMEIDRRKRLERFYQETERHIAAGHLPFRKRNRCAKLHVGCTES